jgi:hypothetical protein
MSNQPQPAANEASQTPVPSETKPAPQQDGGKQAPSKPDQQK